MYLSGCPYSEIADGPITQRLATRERVLSLLGRVRINVMILSFQTNRSGQTVQTQTRLRLEVQSDQGLHCFLFHLHLFDEIP